MVEPHGQRSGSRGTYSHAAVPPQPLHIGADRAILPADWTAFITTPAPGDPSRGYGGLFWLNRGGAIPSAPPRHVLGRRLHGPADADHPVA